MSARSSANGLHLHPENWAGRMGLSAAVAQGLLDEVQKKLRANWQRRMKAEGVSPADNAASRGRWL